MSTHNRLSELSGEQQTRLMELSREFQSNWHPQFLGKFTKQLTQEFDASFAQLALEEIIKYDLKQRWNSGKRPLLESYCKQLPTLGLPEGLSTELILEEFLVRRRHDSSLQLESYRSRFPNQYPELVRLAGESERTNVAVAKPPTSIPTQSAVETKRQAQQDTGTQSLIPVAGIPEQFGRYRIIRELGAGAMGTVYLAHDALLDREVALKTPSFDGRKDSELIARFERECRAAAKLMHRNICQIFDVGEIDGRHYLSMAYIPGRPLADVIAAGELVDQKACAKIIHRLALALAEAHRQKIVHRDLKPANIMIDEFGEPIVMDFGLARHTDEQTRMTQSGMIIGTPAYMAPEQIQGDRPDVAPTADIYALGVILYEMLTGRLPFSGSIAQVVFKIVSEQAPPLSQIRPDVHPGLEAICAQMMAKDVSRRYQTMQAVAIDIKSFHKPSSKLARKPQRQAPARKSEPNRFMMIGGAISLAAILIGVSIFVFRTIGTLSSSSGGAHDHVLSTSDSVAASGTTQQTELAQRPVSEAPAQSDLTTDPSLSHQIITDTATSRTRSDDFRGGYQAANQADPPAQRTAASPSSTNGLPNSPAANPGSDTEHEPRVATSPSIKEITGPTSPPTERVPLVAGPLPRDKSIIDIKEFNEIRRTIRDQLSARDALTLYRAFAQSYEFSDSQLDRVQSELQEFETRAQENLYRLGVEWVTLDKLDQAVNESKTFIDEAAVKLDRRDYDAVIDLLQRATRAYPNGIRADYLLGLVYSLPYSGPTGPDNAIDHFDEILKVVPSHVAALNSRAIAKVKSQGFHAAGKDFQFASEAAGKRPEILHNISRFLHLTESNRLSPDRTIVTEFEDLNQKLTGQRKPTIATAGRGWLHLIPSFPANERTRAATANTSPATTFVLADSGAGFVVAEDYFLTNRQVVENAWTGYGLVDRVEITLLDTQGQPRRYSGHVVALSEKTDLALIFAPGLPGPGFRFARRLPTEETEVISFSMQTSDQSVRFNPLQGEMQLRTDAQSSEQELIVDVGESLANLRSGEPLVNQRGEVLAVMTTSNSLIFPRSSSKVGIPATAVVEFLSQHLQGADGSLELTTAKTEDSDWSELTREFTTSVGRLDVYYACDVQDISMLTTVAGIRGNTYEDKTCMSCFGRKQLPCPNNRNCTRGMVTISWMDTQRIRIGDIVKDIPKPTLTKQDCPDCIGGSIPCNDCLQGLDKSP